MAVCVTFEEQSLLQRAILAYWDTLGIDTDPTPDWKRFLYRVLFGAPFLGPDEQTADARPLSPYEEEMDARQTCAIIMFHLEYLSSLPPGALSKLLWRRVSKLSERAIEIHFQLQCKEEAQDDWQAA